MLGALRQIIRPKYQPFNRLEISADNLLANYAFLRSRQPQAAIFPVLKSNAYGHGLRETCSILARTDVPMVVVDSYPEAQIVYRHFPGRVLIIGEMPLDAYSYLRLEKTEFAVYTEAVLRRVSRYGKKARVHLFLNTGMNREGIQDLPSFITRNRELLDRVEISGFCSHLASADSESELNTFQLNAFRAGLKQLRSAGYFPRWVHLGNSAGVFKLQDDSLTAFRPGLAFYGYNPLGRTEGTEKNLRPALRVLTRIVSLQELSPGESVSYNETYLAAAKTMIAALPFGYYEGLDRSLSNRASFGLITPAGKAYCRSAGQICMNISSIELGLNKPNIGDTVELISPDPSAPNSLQNLADLAGASTYELLVRLQANIRREVI